MALPLLHTPLPMPSRLPLATAWAIAHSNVVGLSLATRAEVALVVERHAHAPAVRAAMLDVLDDETMFPMRMTKQDEERVLGALWACAPVPSTSAKPVDVRIGFVDATTDGRKPVPQAFARLEASWNAGSDVVMAPEWFFVGDAKPLSRTEHNTLVEQLKALTSGSDRLCVPGTIAWADDNGHLHNTAYAFSNGEQLYAIDKRGDGGDVDIARHHALTYFSNDVPSPTFSWRGLTVGLEICRDHGDARLRRSLLASHKDTVDLQLVVSSGVWVKHASVGIGGVVALAQGDGVLQHEQYRRNDDGRLVPLS
jgi:hypothetical protein